MKIVIFGLTVSSSWGNGHATLWRGLCAALARKGHRMVFFEKDVPYYAAHRDLTEQDGLRLCLYRDWSEVRACARDALRDADVGMVTSYCPDGIAATELVLSSPVGQRSFYDMDTPVTLQRFESGEAIEYIGPRRLSGFDVVLSYTGGAALAGLAEELWARRVEPLYGSVDPAVYRPADGARRRYLASYLGTYSSDRQVMLEALLFEPARRMPERWFVLGGSLYPDDLDWPANMDYRFHVTPPEHPRFYSSADVAVSVTRAAMARMGYCPSGRLFEAAACGIPVLSDWWEGLDGFFEPGREILVARTTGEALELFCRPAEELARVGQRARERVLAEHTADTRAEQLLAILGSTASSRSAPRERGSNEEER